jgi:hypothetical protein
MDCTIERLMNMIRSVRTERIERGGRWLGALKEAYGGELPGIKPPPK